MLSDRRHNLISAHVFCTKTKKRTWIFHVRLSRGSAEPTVTRTILPLR